MFNSRWVIITFFSLAIYTEIIILLLPPSAFDIVGDVPWATSYNFSNYNFSNVELIFNVRDFNNRSYFRVGSFIVFSFNLTNYDNKTVSMTENTTMIYPIKRFHAEQNFTLQPNESIIFTQYVPILHEGPNQIDITFGLNENKFVIKYFANPVTQNQHLTLLFNKYSYFFAVIGGGTAIVIAIKNFRDLCKNKDKRKQPESFFFNQIKAIAKTSY